VIGRRIRCILATVVVALVAVRPAAAQSVVTSTSPTLAELVRNVFGPNGLVVDSESVLPDGSTHSAHFNGAFQSEFEQFNIALVRQLVALPVPSPASGFTYSFDSSTGTFARSTQSFGPILADRAETIGRGKFAFGYSLQQFTFKTFDGLPLSHIPAVFTHDDAQLGGGRADVITTQNAIAASVTQWTAFLTYGVRERLDLSLAVPIVHTSLSVVSDATIRRIGTSGSPSVHFFRDADAPGTFGNARRFSAEGSASGVGDIVLRAKVPALKTPRAGVALGLEARLPAGAEEDLIGSGSFGLRAGGVVSSSYGRISPHVNIGYQWNGPTVLAGDIATRQKGDLPNEIWYVAGADVGVERRLSLAFDVIGRRVGDSPRLTRRDFVAQGPAAPTYADIAFSQGTLNLVSGAFGVKFNVAGTLLGTFNLLVNYNDAGLRTKVTPLIGVEYGF
jgi:hypothetical protein